MTARLVALLLPIVAVAAVPTAAQAANYCYLTAAQPSGWIYSWGAVDYCTQPIQAELHLREDRWLQPDREVSADIRYNVTSAFLEVGAFCLYTGTPYTYFVETRVRVNNKDQQKQQSARWTINYYCS